MHTHTSCSNTSSNNSTGLFVGLGLTTALSILALALLAYMFYLFKTGRIRKASRDDTDQYVPAATMSPSNVPQYYGAEPLTLPPVQTQSPIQFQPQSQYSDRQSHYPNSFPQPSIRTDTTGHSHNRSMAQTTSDAQSGSGTFMTGTTNSNSNVSFLMF